MIVYFEDGWLKTHTDESDSVIPGYAIVINALQGVSYCKQMLDAFSKYTVYTNSLLALDNKYAWNEELGIPEIYLRGNDGEWTRIDKLTDRKLTQGHNLFKLYMAGEFNKE